MCTNCSDLLKLPAVTQSVVNGVDGASAYMYVASADSDSPVTGFTYPADSTQAYRAFKTSTSVISSPQPSDFAGLWVKVLAVDGTNGTDGLFGGVSFEYKFNTTLGGAPGSGYLYFDFANVTLTSGVFISIYDVNAVDVSGVITAMLTSTSTTKGSIKITKKDDSSKYVVYTVSSITVPSLGYMGIYVSNTAYSSTAPFALNDEIIITFNTKGDKGTTGSAGAAGSTGATGPGYLATSTTNRSMGLGPSTLTTQLGLAYLPGDRVRFSHTPGTVYMEGVCTAYDGGGTGDITITVDSYTGAGGPHNSWNIGISGDINPLTGDIKSDGSVNFVAAETWTSAPNSVVITPITYPSAVFSNGTGNINIGWDTAKGYVQWQEVTGTFGTAIRMKKVTLTAAQIKTAKLTSVPIAVMSEGPTVNSACELVSCYYFFDYTAPAFDTMTYFSLYSDSTTDAYYQLRSPLSGFLVGAADVRQKMLLNPGTATIGVGGNIMFATDADSGVLGGGTLTLFIMYRTIEIV